eukprot:CAMPEP_0176415582 /NCGR_PEP_ID=MMETSP0127-20121128/5885_1 /TAXON_ID=938130 /ORGANISM="Platyophrya macrostoma, Strain WH" /LENGTH=311 /DNA_ID=CAMNT_0017795591 /DNA_START=1167 /DNA_END=2102 /DNA_ORIENTATION=-
MLDGVGVKHCTDKEKYYPFPEKKFDKYLCEKFWDSHNWTKPHNDESMGMCNYYCPHKDHDKNEHMFCDELAWHTDDSLASKHTFECHEFKNSVVPDIDVCICIDTTGSMESFITQSKEAIKIIIKTVSAINNSYQDRFLFSIVSYKDHANDYSKDRSELVVESLDFTTNINAISFLDSLKAVGGDDAPEAVFDGLYSAHDKSWRAESIKIMFHILDAPPHGKEYWAGNDTYPNGCPCGKNETILKKIKEKGILYYIVPLTSSLNQMIARFEKLITVHKKALNDPLELPQVISSTVCSLIDDPELTAVINTK